MDKIDNSLNPLPFLGDLPKSDTSDVGQRVGIAITATDQKHRDVARQIGNVMLNCVQGLTIGLPIITNHEITVYVRAARRRRDPRTKIAEHIMT